MNGHRIRVCARRRALVAVALAVLALAALPAVGQAAVMKLGSDLTKPANMIEAHGADALFFNTMIDGVPGAMPAGGQITLVRVKGSVLDKPSVRRNTDPVRPMFHVQALHPIDGGRFRVMLSSAGFFLPIVTILQDGSLRGDPQQISAYEPVNLCVNKGDYVDFNDFGGFEWRWGPYGGMPVQAFSRTPGTSLYFYTKNAGTNNGSEWPPDELKQGEELLMQTTLATGPDATDRCPGGFKQHIFTGLEMRSSGATLNAGDGTMKVKTTCNGRNYGGCKGVLLVSANVGGRSTSLGGAPFFVRPAATSTVTVKLTKANAALLKKLGGVAKVIADGHDDPAHDSRARPGVPVQKKKVTKTLRLSVSG